MSREALVASTAEHGLPTASPSERSRNAPTSSSTSAQIRETSDLLIPLAPPNDWIKSSNCRIYTPSEYAS